MSTLIQIVDVVKAVHEAQLRIPPRYHRFTFFSVQDRWMYHAVFDERFCEACFSNYWDDGPIYRGDMMRSHFPYLEIVHVDKIMVNEHPNCRCWLERISPHVK